MSRRRHGYRGSGKHIGVLIPLLAVLCIAAAVALFLINDNMTFTKDGAFFGKKEVKAHKTEKPNLVIENDAEAEDSEKEKMPEQEDNKPSVPESTEERAYFIGLDKVISEAPLDGIPDGVNTVVFEVKSEDGRLAFESDSKLAEGDKIVVGSDEKLKSAIASAHDKGYKVSLCMSCFKDNEAARKNQVYACRTANKVIWLDGENVRWLSAYSKKAQEYLVGIVEKLCTFGADGIVLSNISFPYYGKCELLYYDESLGTKAEQLESFITDAKAAAGDVRLSAVYDNLRGRYLTESGQNVEIFKAFDKIYVSETAGKRTSEYSAAEKEFGSSLCPIVGAVKDSGSFMVK